MKTSTLRKTLLTQLTGLVGVMGLAASPGCADSTQNATPRVKFETGVGDFVVEVDVNSAPVTSANFLAYVDAGFYDGLVFHRVIPGFVVQGGGYTPDGDERATNGPIMYEGNNGLNNDRGTIAMARTQDPNSASSQFYVNLVDNDSLNHSVMKPGYAVFGRVVEGMDAVDKIAEMVTSDRAWNAVSGAPSRPVEIISAERAD